MNRNVFAKHIMVRSVVVSVRIDHFRAGGTDLS